MHLLAGMSRNSKMIQFYETWNSLSPTQEPVT